MRTDKYIKPETIIIEVESEGVIAYSQTVNGTTDVADDGAVYSQRRNFWEEN